MPRPSGDRANPFLVRAGRTPLSAEGRFAGRLDPGLDEQGIAQARAAASALAVEGVAIVLTSPLRRARETAEVVVEACAARVRVVDELTDVDAGTWIGLTREEAAEATPEEFGLFFRFPASATMPGGERLGAGERDPLSARGSLAESSRRASAHDGILPIYFCAGDGAPPGSVTRMPSKADGSWRKPGAVSFGPRRWWKHRESARRPDRRAPSPPGRARWEGPVVPPSRAEVSPCRRARGAAQCPRQQARKENPDD